MHINLPWNSHKYRLKMLNILLLTVLTFLLSTTNNQCQFASSKTQRNHIHWLTHTTTAKNQASLPQAAFIYLTRLSQNAKIFAPMALSILRSTRLRWAPISVAASSTVTEQPRRLKPTTHSFWHQSWASRLLLNDALKLRARRCFWRLSRTEKLTAKRQP